MTSLDRILVPLSLTDTDAGLLRYARHVAKCGIATEFLFVHAAPTGLPDLEFVQRKTELETLVATHFASPNGTRTDIQIGRGPRIDWLIRAAIDFRAHATLLGHRKGRGGTRSLAQRMSQLAPGSVWLVPEASFPGIQRILSPVDFSEHSAHSLSIGTELARQCGLDRCVAMHTSFDPSTLRYYENVLSAREDEQAAFASFVKPIDLHGIRVEPRFEESPKVAASILRVAAEENSDLIVMSTRGRSRAVAILLGSVTAQVMAESPVPVLAVKHANARLNLFHILSDHRLWSQPSPKTN